MSDKPNGRCWQCGSPALILASYYHPHCSNPSCYGKFYDPQVSSGEINVEMAQRLGAEFVKNVGAITRVAEDLFYASEAGEKRPFEVGARVRVTHGYGKNQCGSVIDNCATICDSRYMNKVRMDSRDEYLKKDHWLEYVEPIEKRPLQVGDKVRVRGDGPRKMVQGSGEWKKDDWSELHTSRIGKKATIIQHCSCEVNCGGFELEIEGDPYPTLLHPDDLELVERAE